TKRFELDKAVEMAVEKFGKIDVVYANAGFGVAGRFSKLVTEDYKRQFDVNVIGVLDTVYSCLDQVIKNQGQIVLMGSVNSHVSEPKKTPYCMSKFAIKALADGLFWEMQPLGVAVTLISPGIVESEIRQVDRFGKYDAEAKDPAPKNLLLDTVSAANQIIEAIYKRKKEQIVTLHGKMAVYANRYMPFLLNPLLKQNKSVSRPHE
ncbi:MAG: SDR family NAD(P)-dependent oxidoreductase, partial [Bdellovibrionales bacterium]|nr:SDR family NAD(P)-dependent oxidoreductase [Bdellovibrionales bacterium]